MRRLFTIFIVCIAIGVLYLPSDGYAYIMDFGSLQAESHGHLQSSFIVRDTNGFQYGFLDNLEPTQWLQELLFDLTLKPRYSVEPDFRIEKAYFRYRGAYDAIFDISDHWGPIRKKSPADFELGKDDILYENDLREGFIDLVYQPGGCASKLNVRLGRQIVQWGEADGFNLMNIVNPNDNRKQMFFSTPEDLLTPLWMSRIDFKTGGAGPFKEFNLQFLAIPDIRPLQFAPLDGNYKAPYAVFFQGFSPLFVKEDVKSSQIENTQFGVRAGTNVLGTAIYGYFFDGYQPSQPYGNPIINFTTAADGYVVFEHPRTQTIGYSFNRFMATGNFVLRGEGSITKNAATVDMETLSHGGLGYSKHDFTQILFGIDKNFSGWAPGTRSALTTAFQVYWGHLSEYDSSDAFGRGNPTDDVRLTLLLTTDYYNGRISPTLFFLGDLEGNMMSQIGINYNMTNHWYFNITQMSFWGNKKSLSAFAPFVTSASEVSCKVGWQW